VVPVPVPYVDVLCGGFPCQDLSYAGKGAGLDGERSGLWGEYARLIRELRPRYVVVENVSALLARGLGRVLGDLAACGYDAEWDCIPASAVGAPHRRDRVWLVAYPGGERCSDRRSTARGGSKNDAHRQSLPTPLEVWPTYGAERPTPGASDSDGRRPDPERRIKENALIDAAESPAGDGGQLNPTWVEWLMGFPLGWTDLGASGTPSSRRSRSGSGSESSNGKG
jgi:site-specific DNA-cytosine methylase